MTRFIHSIDQNKVMYFRCCKQIKGE